MAYHNPEKLSVAILAGGKSSRFGESKANAYFGDQTLIDNSVMIGELISTDIVIIKHPQQKLEQPLVPAFDDIIPDCGPLGGIYTALENVKTPWVAVLPCDMPFLTPDIYEIIFSHRSGDNPVVAVSENGIESLVSIWPKSLSPELKKSLLNKEFTTNEILKKFNAVQVSIPEKLEDYQAEFFTNVNFKKELENLDRLSNLLKSNFLKNIENIFEQLS
jgi:molybdopterin-guanine dinucleotide biosynthesis protein A